MGRSVDFFSAHLRLTARHPIGFLATIAVLSAGTVPCIALAADFSGRVVDQQGRPVGKALVEVSGKETITDVDGNFRLGGVAGDRFILNISHADFADLSYVSRTSLTGQSWQLVRAQIQTVDPRSPITLTDTRPELRRKRLGGATFALPANALIDAAGNAPAGPVRAALSTLDVSNGEGPGDWAVRSADGQRDGYLVSYGAVFIQFTDPTGKVKYQLKSGSSGQLSLPVLPSMRATAPRTPRAGYWYYDIKDAYWKTAGNAVFDRTSQSFKGKVVHLSTINTDIAKFNNAACLKLTLDASVATGLKLRIRYHSGGTAFGQAPTFVMNDPVNAAYRLPANTNVRLELLDASDQAFGDLIVESPPGTPSVNAVINTGPPIPAGNTLWPAPPYTDCKPVLLRRGLPQVELRINETSTDMPSKDNPSDDYITWAPTFAVARLVTPMAAPVNVVLTNDAPGIGGDVQFAAHTSPWPANTTATGATLALTLPGDGSWVPFVIAGKFGSPSVNDKDAIIEVHHNLAAGPVIGTKALMVRVRKNANNLTSSESSRFLFAMRNFRNQAGANYVRFQEMHRLASSAGDEAHMQPAFLTWHRAMLLHVERELQKVDPSVALHYWNWDAAAPNVFHQDFIGASNTASSFGVDEPIFSATNPLLGWNTDLPFSGGELRRNTDDHTVNPGTMKPLDHPVDPSLVAWSDYGPTTPGFGTYNSFSDDVEKRSHNRAHGWPCGNGHLTNPNRSAADPLFYLLHSQIDRQWAYWQWKRTRFGVPSGGTLTFPAPAHYDNAGQWNSPGAVADAGFRQKGAFLDDGLWPWDGTSGGPPSTPEERPLNQAPPPGPGPAPEDVPTSRPLIPTSAFPASVQRNLWPSAAAIPRNAHMIDYHGKFRPLDGLGISYDDVPY